MTNSYLHTELIDTSAISFVETEHGRLRRKQRGIDKKDLKSALKHGTIKKCHWDPNYRYITYRDIVYIYDAVKGQEVTCWAKPLELSCVPISRLMQLEHDRACQSNSKKLHSWTSNTVMVVDTSGSMREGDIWGARTRLDSVWIAVALDYLAHRLECGHACSTDVISIVTLEDEPRIVVEEMPCTWSVYNLLVHVYSKTLIPARGHGPFLPALEVAEELLMRNPSASCAMSLTFLSDGKPSDLGPDKAVRICQKVGQIAQKFGRRLTFAGIGIGSSDFTVLEQMVEAANDYGAIGIFQLPSMTLASLGEAFTSVATSVTSVQTEMTDLETKKQRKVRDVMRESKSKASEVITSASADDFYLYRSEKVVRSLYKEWVEDKSRKYKFEQTSLQHPRAKFVAFSKGPFGEGAERFAYRFFEVAADGETIVGKPLVAKENRLLLDNEEDTEAERKRFVESFCRTQQLARRLANEFNKKMDAIPTISKKTPRITFLDCSIYQLDDKYLGKQSVLVEERIDDSKWTKWNANNGWVGGMKKAPEYSQACIRKAFTNLDLQDLTMIEEGSEEESDDSDHKQSFTQVPARTFSPFEVAQSFSHFSYIASGRRRLVCDLQGVYDEEANILRLSDPVIHYDSAMRKNVHGRTDRGRKGMAMFFDTHHEHCDCLCRLMTRGLRRRLERKKISFLARK